jgi:hypothetical protein
MLAQADGNTYRATGALLSTDSTGVGRSPDQVLAGQRGAGPVVRGGASVCAQQASTLGGLQTASGSGALAAVPTD